LRPTKWWLGPPFRRTRRVFPTAGGVAAGTLPALASSCGDQLIANPGFESGSVSWTASSGVIDGSGKGRTGSYSAWLDGYGSSHPDTVSQQVAIPSGCSSYTLSFWLKITSSETTTSTAYDKLTVKVGSQYTTSLALLEK
jgi:aminopeptidase S